MARKRTAPVAIITVATRTRTIRDDARITVHALSTGHTLPWRIARRGIRAHKVGLDYVKTLGERGDVVAVTVTDGRRPLASWRRMTGGMGGFTGTHPRDVEALAASLPREVVTRGGAPIVAN